MWGASGLVLRQKKALLGRRAASAMGPGVTVQSQSVLRQRRTLEAERNESVNSRQRRDGVLCHVQLLHRRGVDRI